MLNCEHAIAQGQSAVTTLSSVWSGVTISGAAATKTYNGEGYVVGKTFNGRVSSNTLGTSDGATDLLDGRRNSSQPTDTFLANITFLNATSANPATDPITINFPSKIYSVSFDYEIFPDGSCPNPNSSKTKYNLNCASQASSNWLDFELYADSSLVFSQYGNIPQPCPNANCHSPNSRTYSCEKAPQYLGTTSTYFFPGGVTKLEFVDWPEMIGIDNLVVDYTPSQRTNSVPEPISMLLLGLGLIGLRSIIARRGRKQEE